MDINQSYRSMVLAVAQHATVKGVITSRAKGFARRFVAGDTLQEALQVVNDLEKSNVHSILDLFGEMVDNEAQAQQFKQGIITLIQAFGKTPYPRYIALKLTQLGLDLSEDLAYKMMLEIVSEAKKHICFVRIDMEDSPRIDATLRIYKRLRESWL